MIGVLGFHCFDVNRFLLIGQMFTNPAVTILLGVVTAVVFISRNDLDSWCFRQIVPDGEWRSVIYVKIAGIDLLFYGIENRLLLLGGIRAPERPRFFFVEMSDPTAIL